MVDDVKYPDTTHAKYGLGNYQHIRRMVIAVLIVVLFAALLSVSYTHLTLPTILRV